MFGALRLLAIALTEYFAVNQRNKDIQESYLLVELPNISALLHKPTIKEECHELQLFQYFSQTERPNDFTGATARAGEQGRGFAVVADEVRALAERTTRATKEIGEMIKAIQRETKGAVAAMEQGVHQVETGTEEASKSGQALLEILEQVNDVATQVHQIATAAEEQTATTGEISSNMMQITAVVQQTSRGAHESAKAAAQLNVNAEELQRLVRQFKL
jgi:uncharacterized phage infection (PIP) family protein YhgE